MRAGSELDNLFIIVPQTKHSSLSHLTLICYKVITQVKNWLILLSAIATKSLQNSTLTCQEKSTSFLSGFVQIIQEKSSGSLLREISLNAQKHGE